MGIHNKISIHAYIKKSSKKIHAFMEYTESMFIQF